MRTRQLSILAALLTVGCAHGKSDAATAKAGNESNKVETARAANNESAEEQASRDADDSERVEVPASGARRGRLANAGGELPADKPSTSAQSAEAYGTSPDNTRVNERDRESSSLTPMDQKENEGDLEITQRIRKAVIADDSLSFTAKNVKIITRDGQVTLRGSVKSAAEKSAIEQAARSVAGAAKVINEIEVSE